MSENNAKRTDSLTELVCFLAGGLLHGYFPVHHAVGPTDQRSHVARSLEGNPLLPLPRFGTTV